MAIKSRNLHTMGFFGKMWRSGPGPPPRDVAVEQPGAELPAHSLGPRLFFKDDGTEFVSQGKDWDQKVPRQKYRSRWLSEHLAWFALALRRGAGSGRATWAHHPSPGAQVSSAC
jgi:hypothetical protein